MNYRLVDTQNWYVAMHMAFMTREGGEKWLSEYVNREARPRNLVGRPDQDLPRRPPRLRLQAGPPGAGRLQPLGRGPELRTGHGGHPQLPEPHRSLWRWLGWSPHSPGHDPLGGQDQRPDGRPAERDAMGDYYSKATKACEEIVAQNDEARATRDSEAA